MNETDRIQITGLSTLPQLREFLVAYKIEPFASLGQGVEECASWVYLAQ